MLDTNPPQKSHKKHKLLVEILAVTQWQNHSVISARGKLCAAISETFWETERNENSLPTLLRGKVGQLSKNIFQVLSL